LTEEVFKAAIASVMNELVDRIPGDEWVKTPEMRERFGV